jgi:hypothetical protein
MAFLKYRGSTIAPGTWSANAFANAPLTNLDIDKNFASLDAQKLDLSGGTISGALAIGQNLTAEFKDDQVSFVDGADTAKKLAFQLSGIATGTTKTLTIPNNDGTIALTSDIGNGALTISAVAAAATNNTVTLELSGAYSANTSTARTLDLKVGPALTALATLMTTATAGFIRRAAADTYAIDTNTYSTTSHGHFIGTTAVQASSANQALTGITGLSSPNDASLSSSILITSGLGIAASSISGGVEIATGATNGTVTNGGSSGTLRLQTGASGTNGAAGNIVLQAGITGGSSTNGGSIYLYGGSSTNGTFSDNGHIYIKAGSATAATGTKSGGKVWIDGGRTATGGTVVDDGQVNIGTEVGSPGGSGTALVNIGNNSSTTNIRGTVVIAGNLTVNGTTTTINSNTVSVDDRNIELGAVTTGTVTGNITANSNTITGLSSTVNVTEGSVIVSASGAQSVTIPANLTVIEVVSPTQILVNQALTGSGIATGAVLTFSGANNATANGGGITLKGTTDKTILWDSTNSNWTSSENWNIATGKTFKINNVDVLSATTLGTAVVNSSLTKLGTVAGFVKSDASGNLSADTNTYLTAEADTLATVTGRSSGATTATAISLTNNTASTTTATGALVVTGGVGIGGTVNATDFNSTSDIRFKKDLEKISNALSKVKQLTGYTYTLIETNTRSTGLIAQDVEEILPESVGGDDHKKTLSYGSMMGLIVEAIKELSSKVEDLQNQLMNK